MVIARMGYSKELCYEIFLQDHSKGDELWEMLWEAGQDMNISPGGPNMILRLEGGIISYLSDVDKIIESFSFGYSINLGIKLDFNDDYCLMISTSFCIRQVRIHNFRKITTITFCI